MLSEFGSDNPGRSQKVDKEILKRSTTGNSFPPRTKIMSQMKKFLLVGAMFILAAIFAVSAYAAGGFFGAIFTTFNDGATVNGNIYPNKDAVYLNGGPQNANANGLPNGTYYFEVTDPSGAVLLSLDPAVCRQVTVANNVVSGASLASGGCAHANGAFNPVNGSTPVQLQPFADTPNHGGEYKVWLIRQASTTSIVGDPSTSRVLAFLNSNVKTDNFKVNATTRCTDDCGDITIGGSKYYDANANGIKDPAEVPIEGVRIEITINGGTPIIAVTGADGTWSLPGVPDGATYSVRELLPITCETGTYWVQTGPVADSNGFQGYNGTANGDVTNLDFGDICFGPASGGLTLGYWSNKNGQSVMTTGGPNGVDQNAYIATAGTGLNGDLLFLRNFNLANSSLERKSGNIMPFDPTNYTDFRTWLLNGNAVNMAYMLSVQLSATSLDVRHRYLSDNQIVDASSVGLGITTIGLVRVAANVELGLPGGNNTYTGSPLRDDEEILKNFLDAVNNNRLPFAHADPCNVCYPEIVL